jgi:hypothetical protein
MKSFFYFSFLTLFVLGCNSAVDSTDASAIALNDGAKWKVNPEMTPHIEAAAQKVADYLSNEDADHKTLATALETHNMDLIKSCTMKGKSHDELHKWLYPHIELIKQLKEAENEEAAKKIIDQIDASFQTYATHFQ